MQNERVAVVESVEWHFSANEPFCKDTKNAALYESGIVEKRRRLLLFILVGETIDHIEVDSVLLDDHVVIEAIGLIEHRLRGETGLPIRDTGLRVALDDVLETERAFLTEVRRRVLHIERQRGFCQQRLTDLLAMQLIEFEDTFITQVQDFLGFGELNRRGAVIDLETVDGLDTIIRMHDQMPFRAQEVDDVPQGGHFAVALGLFVLLDDPVHGDSEQFVVGKGQVEAGLQAILAKKAHFSCIIQKIFVPLQRFLIQ